MNDLETRAEPSAVAYYLVYLFLMVLLLVTVMAAFWPLGAWKIVVAMAIATVKACLVLWYFMHLRGSPRLVLMLFGMSFVILTIGAVVMIADYLSR
jgi:cytochrome c oxidase subunit 4